MTHKQRLAQVRESDAIHEQKMQAIAKAAGVRLDRVRAVGPKVKQRDEAMVSMIDAAAKNGVTYNSFDAKETK